MSGSAVARHVEDAVDVPLLHLVDVTAEAVRSAGLDHVAVLGTRFTMEEPFYRERMELGGVRTVVPDADGRELVNRVIYDELVLGRVLDDSRRAFSAVIERLAAAGAQGVVLGCTEIELLVRPEDSPVPVFGSTQLHAAAAVDFALG